jgi:hypothetical protein
MVRSAAEFIEAKGVPALVAATGRTPGAIRVWKHRSRFPREAWLELAQAFPELTLEVLTDLEAKSPARAA